MRCKFAHFLLSKLLKYAFCFTGISVTVIRLCPRSDTASVESLFIYASVTHVEPICNFHIACSWPLCGNMICHSHLEVHSVLQHHQREKDAPDPV